MSTPSAQLAPADQMQRIDPRSITAGRIAAWTFTLILAGVTLPGLGTALLLTHAPNRVGVAIGFVAAVVVLSGIALLSHVRPLWHYRYTFYRIDPYGIEIARGRFFQHLITVPHARVQHIDVLQGPLARRYDIADLVIFTAGTTHSAVRLSGLSHPVALALRERLVKERGLDAV